MHQKWSAAGSLLLMFLLDRAAIAHAPPLLPEWQVAALANELSGEIAKRNLEGLATLHRQRGSSGFESAAQLIADRARAYGLHDVTMLRLPADGTIFYGTQRSRPAWDVDAAELSEIHAGAETRIGSFAAEPVVLAEDSESADLTALLVDVGSGMAQSDYAGKDVRGKLVLTAAAPGEVQDLAVGKYGAAGIVSYAQNQKTAWSGENDDLIRWGHLQTFSSHKTFGFMVSLKTARAFMQRLGAGEQISLHARVQAGQHPGAYDIVTATIPGGDAALKEQEIAFSCHLDHQRPGANDNASGCVSILEVGRALAVLIDSGRLPRPARTLRFIWPPEIEGTTALLNAKPEFAARIKAVVHMDMVGGNLDTKAVFHITQGPMSLPSFVHDIAWAFAQWVNTESYELASGGHAQYPMNAAEGGKDPLRADYSSFEMGSDHDVYQDSSFGVPAIYMNDWPDRYIHTNFDAAANIDPTKLKRAAFIGAASGYFLANYSPRDIAATQQAIALGKLQRAATALQRHTAPDAIAHYETAVLQSANFFGSATRGNPAAHTPILRDAYRRAAAPRGPLAVFGYDYFESHAEAASVAIPRLVSFQGEWGAGPEYAYETLNFADGTRSVQQICAAVSAEYGTIPLALVEEYLQALAKIGVVH